LTLWYVITNVFNSLYGLQGTCVQLPYGLYRPYVQFIVWYIGNIFSIDPLVCITHVFNLFYGMYVTRDQVTLWSVSTMCSIYCMVYWEYVFN